MSWLRFSSAWLVVAALVLLTVPARADATADDARFQAFDIAMARDYLLPRYQALLDATGKQEQSWMDFCRQPSADGFAAVRASFGAGMDAWIPLQHVHTGPASLKARIERIYFWPVLKNAVARQVATLLQAEDSAVLAPDRFATQSVAVQGFSALHLLLYENEDPAAPFLAGDPAAAYRCAYGTAVAHNLKAVAGELVDGWNAAIETMSAVPAKSPKEYGLPDAPKETAQQMFTDLLSLFLIVGDFKLGLPLDNSVDSAKPKLAESWRSGRSLRNIGLNLESAQAMYGKDRTSGFRSLLPAGSDNDALDGQITDALTKAIAAVATIPMPLDAAVTDASARPKVEALLDDIKRARDFVGQRLSSAIGLSVGFNGLDGD